MNAWKTLGIVVTLLTVFAQKRAKAEVVYDGIGQVPAGEGIIFGATGLEPDPLYLWLASLAQLDGASRRISSLEFNVHGRDNPVTTSIFGALFLNDDSSRPGSLLWKGTPRDISLSSSGLQTVSIDVPFVVVPDQIWVVAGVAYAPGPDSTLRFRANGGPLTGSILENLHGRGPYQAVDDEWQESNGAWAIRVNAVPEPSSFVLGAMILCTCCGYRRFRGRA